MGVIPERKADDALPALSQGGRRRRRKKDEEDDEGGERKEGKQSEMSGKEE